MIYDISDEDDDCAAGLMCLQRSDDDDPVSAYCEGMPDDDSDYCVPNPEESIFRGESSAFREELSAILTEPTYSKPCGRFCQTILGDGLFQVHIQVREECLLDVLDVKVVYNGIGWVGFGIGENGVSMVGATAIIGLPDSGSSPAIYHLNARDVAGVVLDEQQTLMEGSTIEQNSTHTVLSFTKFLREKGHVPIVGDGRGDAFFVAAGSSNELGYHAHRYIAYGSHWKCVMDCPGDSNSLECQRCART